MTVLHQLATIALVEPSEYVALDRLIRDAYEHDYGPRESEGDELSFAENRARHFDVWAAKDQHGRLVGSVTTPSIGGAKLMEDSEVDEIDFRLLAVDSAVRGHGIGALLTRHVIELARERGLRRVFMKSGPQMTGAHRLYRKLGFHRDTRRDGLIIGGEHVLDLFAFTLTIENSLPEDTA